MVALSVAINVLLPPSVCCPSHFVSACGAAAGVWNLFLKKLSRQRCCWRGCNVVALGEDCVGDVAPNSLFDVMKLNRVVMSVSMPFEKADSCLMTYSLNVLLFHRSLF